MYKITITILVFQAACLACSSRSDDTTQSEEQTAVQQEAAADVNDYPAIVLKLEDGEEISAKTMEGKNIFIFFQPECDHCQQEAMDIEQRLDDFKAYTLYFISSSPMPQISEFAKAYALDGKEKVKFAWTSTEGVLTYYGPIQTPSIYIYSGGKLVKSFNGKTDVEELISRL